MNPDRTIGARPHPDSGPTPYQRLSRRHDAATVRTWARSRGMELAPTGGLPRYVYALYEAEIARDEATAVAGAT
ncbi:MULTISPECIES: Lsr2 family DNA-binding protein [unclassified Nocardioides]|uniref:Lsr2 family DNA-binding protein n=1 Tax=unclassified Nocardioides TaxID=2615069 RepID=UPI0030153D07